MCGDHKFNVHKDDIEILTLDDDPIALDFLIHYMYQSANQPLKIHDQLECIISLDLKNYAIAGRYEIKHLQKLAAERMATRFEGQRSVRGFVSAIRLLDTTTDASDPTLWNAFVTIVRNNMDLLMKDESFMQCVLETKELNVRLPSLLYGGERRPSSQGGPVG